jgi:hypothetical protein
VWNGYFRLEQLMSGMSRDFDLSRRAALPGR